MLTSPHSPKNPCGTQGMVSVMKKLHVETHPLSDNASAAGSGIKYERQMRKYFTITLHFRLSFTIFGLSKRPAWGGAIRKVTF
jgi:hypothetical protein